METTILTIVGERIKDYRLQQRLSRRLLGTAIGISGQALWKIETGRSDPKLVTLSKIAAALGVRVASLLEEEDMMGMLQKYREVLIRQVEETEEVRPGPE